MELAILNSFLILINLIIKIKTETTLDNLLSTQNRTEVYLEHYYSWREPTIAYDFVTSKPIITISDNLINQDNPFNLSFSSFNPFSSSNSSFNSTDLLTNLSSNLTEKLSSLKHLSNLTNSTTDFKSSRLATELSNANTLYDVPVYLIVLLALAYGLVSLTAVLGNGIVLYFVVRSKKLRTITNIFIANLSIADILIGKLTLLFINVYNM